MKWRKNGYMFRTKWFLYYNNKKKRCCFTIATAILILVLSLWFTPIVSASHPSSPDSDNDGIPDGWEIKYGLNPDDPNDVNQDYNNDGLTNLEEYESGLDPFSRDTDNDRISNYAEVTGLFGFVTDPLNGDTDGDGLTDLEEIVTYIHVSSQIQMDELFVDTLLIKDLKKRYYPYKLDPLNPDVDNDGLLDGEEMTRGTSPTYVDSDADGLTDYEEVFIYSTNPTNIDTDGDWLSDKEELTGGSYCIITDPNNPDTDGDGISDGEELLAFALVMVPPSRHVLTYEEFITDNSYAGEYVTMKARVKRITHEPQDRSSYLIRLKSLNLSSGLQSKRGFIRVGNSWHYDIIEHKVVFIDDVFGYILKEDDVILITGVAGKFLGMDRELTVKTNNNDAEGCIYLLLDPKEALSRISVYKLASPLTDYPFWSHVMLVSVSPNYVSWSPMNLTSAQVSTSNSTSNSSTTTTDVSESSSEITFETEEANGLLLAAATDQIRPEAKEDKNDLLINITIGIGVIIVFLLLYANFLMYAKQKEKKQGEEGKTIWVVTGINKKGEHTYEVAINKEGKSATIELNKRLYKQLIRKKRLVIGKYTILIPVNEKEF